jgi:hypothetical protein
VYPADWADTALSDLRRLGVPPSVASQLFRVSKTALRFPPDLDPNDPDEGSIDSLKPYQWRRGLTREQRRRLNEKERQRDAREDADDIHQAWNYVLIYRPRKDIEIFRRRGKGFLVERVYHNKDFGDLLGGLMDDL